MADQNNADIASIETFYGSITSIDDALLLVQAVRLGTARRLRCRLTETQQLLIRSGSVFVWNEGETKIKRWTDGRHWSNSRMKGRFFLYKELAASKKTGTARARVAVAAAATSNSATSATTPAAPAVVPPPTSPQSATSDDIDSHHSLSHTNSNLGAASPPPTANNATALRAASDRVFLRKKTISFQTREGEKYHLIAYYHGQSEVTMSRPSQVAEFSELVIEPGFYFTGLDMTPLMLSVKNPTATLAEQSPTESASTLHPSPSFAAAPTQPSASPSLPNFSQANLPNAAEEASHSPVLAASRTLQPYASPTTAANPSNPPTARTVPVSPSTHASRSTHPGHRQTRADPKEADMRRRDSWVAPEGRDYRDYPQYPDRSRSSHSQPGSRHDPSPHYPSHNYGMLIPGAPTTPWPGQSPYSPAPQYHPPAPAPSYQPFSASSALTQASTAPHSYSAPPPGTASAWQPGHPCAPSYYPVPAPAHAYLPATSYFSHPAQGYYPHPTHSTAPRADAVQCHRGPDQVVSTQEPRSTPAIEAGGQAESGSRTEEGEAVAQQMTERMDGEGRPGE